MGPKRCGLALLGVVLLTATLCAAKAAGGVKAGSGGVKAGGGSYVGPSISGPSVGRAYTPAPRTFTRTSRTPYIGGALLLGFPLLMYGYGYPAYFYAQTDRGDQVCYLQQSVANETVAAAWNTTAAVNSTFDSLNETIYRTTNGENYIRECYAQSNGNSAISAKQSLALWCAWFISIAVTLCVCAF